MATAAEMLVTVRAAIETHVDDGAVRTISHAGRTITYSFPDDLRQLEVHDANLAAAGVRGAAGVPLRMYSVKYGKPGAG